MQDVANLKRQADDINVPAVPIVRRVNADWPDLAGLSDSVLELASLLERKVGQRLLDEREEAPARAAIRSLHTYLSTEARLGERVAALRDYLPAARAASAAWTPSTEDVRALTVQLSAHQREIDRVLDIVRADLAELDSLESEARTADSGGGGGGFGMYADEELS